MAVAIVRDIKVVGNSISLTCETDLTATDGSAVYFNVSFTRLNLAVWLEDNPALTAKDFLKEKAQELYTLYEKGLAKTVGLLNQDIFTL